MQIYVAHVDPNLILREYSDLIKTVKLFIYYVRGHAKYYYTILYYIVKKHTINYSRAKYNRIYPGVSEV